MRVLQRLADLRCEKQRLLPAHRPLLGHILLERNAFQQLHDNILQIIGMADVVHRNDIRVRQHSDGLRLRLKPALELRILRHILPQNFNGDIAVQPVAQRFIDNGHAAAADDFENLVAVVEHLPNVFVL